MKTRCFHFAVLLLICFSIPLIASAQVVDIPDLNLRIVVEATLDKELDHPITVEEIATLTRLDARDAHISDLTGLEFATNLRLLGLGGQSVPDPSGNSNSVSDLSPLSGLTQLISLGLSGNAISDISPLSGLTQLISLGLSGNAISDISPLSGLIHLESLGLEGNAISDLSPLSGLANLTSLSLSSNAISDISPLSGLINLKWLSLSNNAISDISVLSHLADLKGLSLMDNSVSDLSPLSGIIGLSSLRLEGNSIWDISPLVANTGLGNRDSVYVKRNPLGYPSIHTYIPALQEGGVLVSFDDRTPTTLLKISGAVTAFKNWLVVEVRDGQGRPFAGVWVTFTVTEGGGTLRFTRTPTDRNGRAESQLTLGADGDANRVRVSADGISEAVPFSDVPEVGVNIPEPNLRAAIETALNKRAGNPITADEISTLTHLEVSGAGIRILTGLELAVNLTVLDLSSNALSDISPLSDLTHLTALYLFDNAISDISPLVGLTRLTTLRLDDNTISDISAVSALTNLITLRLDNNAILDIPVMSGLTHLTALHLDGNMISDISPLVDLTHLTTLHLDSNVILDISAVSGLTHLTALSLSGNAVLDISPLVGLTHLTTLRLDNNAISDISAVSPLIDLRTLHLDNNTISDISALSGLTNLTSLSLSDNLVLDIAPLVANTGLGRGDEVYVRENPLSYPSITTYFPMLQSRGVAVEFGSRTPTTLLNISGTITALNNVLVVEVQDSLGQPFAGVLVAFTVTGGGGTLSTTHTTTDRNGRAESRLTLGEAGDANTVRASVEGISEVVTFTDVPEPTADIPDPNLRTAVEMALNKQAGAPITVAEMTTLLGLTALNANISDLTGLELATNLALLDLGSKLDDPDALGNSNSVSDLSPLSGLTALQALYLASNAILDISALSGLTHLYALSLSGNAISDISALSGLTNLSELYLTSNAISDISVLSGLTNLSRLYLSNNAISDISVLSGLTDLSNLYLSDNAISDISVLSGLTNLSELYLSNNAISDISAVSGLTNLQDLWLGSNVISDILALSGLTNLLVLNLEDNAITDIWALSGLTELAYLNLSDNSVSDILPLSGLTRLSGLRLSGNGLSDVSALVPVLSGFTHLESLSLSNNAITDISALAGFTNLYFLRLEGNAISDISTLSGLTNLFLLNLEDNAITDISALSGLTKLVWLHLSNNAITDISPLVANTGLESRDTVDVRGNPLSSVAITSHIPTLQERGVTVHFDPLLLNFHFFVPEGISFIHVPMKVAMVDGDAKSIDSVGNLYDVLGGADAVNLLVTHDSKTQEWRSYLGESSRDSLADVVLTDDKGIIVSIKTPVSVRFSGDALGTDGRSSIMLHPGTNLVGVPLKDSRITSVSDLLNLEGIRGNVPEIIVSDGGVFKQVTQAGDDGDIPLTGGGAFILFAQEAATVAIAGDGWNNASESTAAPPMALGIQVDGATPVLAVTGSVISLVGERGVPSGAGFRVTVKNLSTGKVDTVMVGNGGVGYQLTFVDMERGRAAQTGDILEISAESPNPLIGVEPLRYTVTAEDVKRSYIQLGELVAYVIPTETKLLPNYPNPFNPETWIPYRLAADADVSVTIYDLGGGVVRRLHVGLMVAAAYERRDKAVYWDGRNEFGERVASGIYFCTLTAGDYSATRKMVISK